jgi:hypothetical protein
MAENKQEVEDLTLTLQRIREAQLVYSSYTQSQVDKIFFMAAKAAARERIPSPC